MGKDRCSEFLEASFLAPLLKNGDTTDISYNGEDFFVMDNFRGRRKADLKISKEEVGDFLRQIANFSERQFSYLSPILDVSFSNYRLNATFLSTVRVKNEKSYSFSLRIGKQGSAVVGNESFFEGQSKQILLDLLKNGDSIIIGGDTGSGKTELQKYLLMNLAPATRVLVIDNVEELELCRDRDDIDMTTWLVDEKNPQSTFSSLIRNALRNNPDYIVLAESRGKEMMEAIHCAMSGHPLIITLHSFSLEQMPSRVARLAMQSNSNLVYSEILEDVRLCMQTYVFLEKEIQKGQVLRRISGIGRINKKGEWQILYSREK